MIYICSEEDKEKYENKKRIILNDNIKNFPEKVSEPLFYPILFHPQKLLGNSETIINNISKERKIGILFIGNSNSYDKFKDIIHNDFNIYTRNEVLDFIKEKRADIIFSPNSYEELKEKLEAPDNPLKNKIVLIDKIRISGKPYFELYCYSKFHLWTCGFVQPYCHNQIESMACGAIPIYQKYTMYPDLNDNINSLSYNNFDELLKIIDRITENNQDFYSEQMNISVLEIYKNNFSLTAFGNKIEKFLNDKSCDELTYYICPKITK